MYKSYLLVDKENFMIIPDISQTLAELYKSLILELRPDWDVQVIEEDYNLYKMGFIDDIPCSLIIEIAIEQIERLYDEIIDMEIGVYLYEDLLTTSSHNLSKEERELQKQIKLREREYYKFAQLEGLCLEILNEEEML